MASIGKNNRNVFLFFRDSASSMLCIPANKITLVATAGDTDVEIYYETLNTPQDNGFLTTIPDSESTWHSNLSSALALNIDFWS